MKLTTATATNKKMEKVEEEVTASNFSEITKRRNK